MKGVFVTATGTGCGKTWLARGLAREATRLGRRVAALKPIETGVIERAGDALALAAACHRPELADAPGLVRRRGALSPRAAELSGEAGVDLAQLAVTVRGLIEGADLAVIEGAGGVLTPVSRGTTIADLAQALGYPVLLVAPNVLGTLSHTLAAAEGCEKRGLDLLAVVLVDPLDADASITHNHLILREETGIDVHRFSRCEDGDELLAEAVRESGLLGKVLPS